jgi:hypothetical protein
MAVSIATQKLGNEGDFLADGSVPMTGTLDMGTNLISNVVDPVSAQDSATKNYVDNVAAGVSFPTAAVLGTL